jgi:hypothetical protein
LEKRLREAKHVIKKLDEKAAAEGEGMDARRRAAQRRSAREALERATAALAKLKKLEEAARPSHREQVRVSDSEPEARNMKHADGGCGPSYNVQVTTEATGPFIVGIGVCTAANDTQELMPAVDRVKSSCGAIPEQIIADGGYATRNNVEETNAQKITLIAPWKEAASREAGACKSNGIEAEFAPSEFSPPTRRQEANVPGRENVSADSTEDASWSAAQRVRSSGAGLRMLPVEEGVLRKPRWAAASRAGSGEPTDEAVFGAHEAAGNPGVVPKAERDRRVSAHVDESDEEVAALLSAWAGESGHGSDVGGTFL